MRHDPERFAAAYLGQAMSRRSRARFEHHLLGCADCWGEVAAARRGRSAAESLRELASPALRDRVRAVVETVPDEATGPARPRRTVVAVFAAAAAALLVVGGVTVSRRTDAPLRDAPGVAAVEPAPLTALVAAYGDPGGWSRTGSEPPARTLDGLSWSGSRRADLGGQDFVVHRYERPGARSVLVARSSRPLPRAAAARPAPGADWVAEVDRMTVLCLTSPVAALVIGGDVTEVAAVAADLGRR